MPKTLTSSGTKRGLFTRQDFIYDAEHDHYTCPAGAKLTKIHRRVDHTEDFDRYRHLSACFTCPLRSQCTPTKLRRITRWVNEDVLDRMQDRLDRMPEAMGVRRQTVEHPFGTLKAWMGATHFPTRTLDNGSWFGFSRLMQRRSVKWIGNENPTRARGLDIGPLA